MLGRQEVPYGVFEAIVKALVEESSSKLNRRGVYRPETVDCTLNGVVNIIERQDRVWTGQDNLPRYAKAAATTTAPLANKPKL